MPNPNRPPIRSGSRTNVAVIRTVVSPILTVSPTATPSLASSVLSATAP